MSVRYEPKDPARAALCGTLEGFFMDLDTCLTPNGVRAVMRKHFYAVSENAYVLTVQVNEDTYIYLAEIQTQRKRIRKGGHKKRIATTRYECHLQCPDKDILIWYQERDADHVVSGQGYVVDAFRAQTEALFHPIHGLCPADIEELVRQFVMERLTENAVAATVVDVAVTGSRSRGLEHEASDLDVVVELATDEREDVLFDCLNQEPPLCVEGVLVDINPITVQRTGDLSSYLLQVGKYLHARCAASC